MKNSSESMPVAYDIVILENVPFCAIEKSTKKKYEKNPWLFYPTEAQAKTFEDSYTNGWRGKF